MITQEQAIVKYLKTHKSASGIDFVKKLGILSYTKRISQIRWGFAPNNGYKLVTEMKTVKTRYGNARVAVYSLVKKK